MNNKTLLLLLASTLLAVLVAAAILYNNYSDKARLDEVATAPAFTPPTDAADTSESTDATEGEEEVYSPAPVFTVYDSQGNPVELEDFLGKPVIVNFWASWCGPCTSEMPVFQTAYEKYGDEIHFVMINATDGSRETLETASDFIEENGYTFPVYYDTGSIASINYNVQSLPSTYFIDSEGLAIAYATGAMNNASLKKGIDMILK